MFALNVCIAGFWSHNAQLIRNALLAYWRMHHAYGALARSNATIFT